MNQNPALLEITRHFQAFLTESGLSRISVKNYVSDIRQFLISCQISSARIITAKHITEYLAKIKSTKPEATQRRYLASIRRFITFLAIEYRLELPDIPSPTKTATSHRETKNTFSVSDKFRDYLAKENKTFATIKNYLSDLNHFLSWSAKYTPPLSSRATSGDLRDSSTEFTPNIPAGVGMTEILTENTLLTYFDHLKLNHTSTSVINRRESSLRKFVQFSLDAKLIIHNPFEKHLPLPSIVLRPIQFSTTKHFKTEQNPDSLAFVPYLHLGILVLAITSLSLFGYHQIFKNAAKEQAFPAAPVRPSRQLAFQGRLTDNSDNPVTAPTAAIFRLFNQAVDGNTLYQTNPCQVTPDQDGIFSTLIGGGGCGPEIGPEVFSENGSLFMEVTVGGQTLIPRQPIATSGYALNSETLQGYPASESATPNTVPVVDSKGQIGLGGSSPAIVASNGNFALKGNALTLTTNVGTDGNITIAPDGRGKVNINGGVDKGVFLHVNDANLTTGTLIEGYVGNNDPRGTLLHLASGTKMVNRLTVSTRGQTDIIAETYKNSAFSIKQTGTGPIFAGLAGNKEVARLTTAGDLGLLGGLSLGSPYQTHAWPGQILTNINSRGMAGVIINQNDSGPILTASSSGLTRFVVANNGNVGINTDNPTQGRLVVVGLTWTDQLTVAKNPVSGYILTSDNGGNATWQPVPSGSIGAGWTLAAPIVYPNETTYQVLIGANATASATAKLSVYGDSATQPAGYFTTTSSGTALVVNNDGSGDLFAAQNGGTTKVSITSGGNLIFGQASIIDSAGTLSINTTNNQAITTGTGQITLAGNVDATNGLDVTNANLTVGGANFTVAPASGNITTAGTLTLPNSNTLTGVASYTQFNNGISVGGATTYNIASTGNANLNATTVTSLDSTGDATISGNLTFYGGARIIASRLATSLTLGDSQTGNIIIAPGGTTALTAIGNDITLADTLTVNGSSVTLAGDSSIIDMTGTGTLGINTTTNRAITTGTGQITLAGNVDATNGLDVTNANLTVGGANFTVAPASGNITTAGTLTLPNSNTLTGVASYTQFNNGISVGGATTYNIASTGNANLNATTVTSLTDTGTATIAGALTIYSTPTINTTSMQTLTIGGATTGNLSVAPQNGATGAYFAPSTDNQVDLGTSSLRWRYIYGNINPGFTPGSVVFAGSSGELAQDNTNFFWDDTTNRLGIGTISPAGALDVTGGSIYTEKFSSTESNQTRGLVVRGTNGNIVGSIQGLDNDTVQFLSHRSGGLRLYAENGISEGKGIAIDQTGKVGMGTSSPLATLDIHANIGTAPVASISGATSIAALVVDNSGVGDIFTASSSGLNRFVIKQSGYVGIGTTTPSYLFDVSGGTGIVGRFSGRVIGADAVNTDEFITLGQASGGAGGPWTRAAPNVYLTTSTDQVGIGTSSPVGKFQVINEVGTTSAASISATSSFAALVIDQSGTGDILTASSAGLKRLAVTRDGNLSFFQNSQINTTGTLLIDSTGTLSINTTNNQAITTGTGLTTLGGNLTINGTSLSLAGATGLINSTTGTLSINTTNNQAITTGTGQITLAGNVDATNGVDITNANLTVGGANFTVAPGTGNITTAGDAAINGGDLTTTNATFNLVNATATTINVAGAATTLNIAPTGASGSISLSGGSGDTGCTLDGTTGNFTCSGNIFGSSTGTQGYWQRNSGVLTPTNLTDDVTLGSTSTTSAKFAFYNVAAGTPTASIGGSLAIAVPTGTNPATTYDILNGGTFNLRTSAGGDAGLASRLFITNAGNVGINTATPGYLFTVTGSKTDYLAQIYNTDTTSSSQGLQVRVDGTGNILNLNASGSDIVTVTSTQTTVNNPAQFTSPGDVSIAYDLVFTNPTASFIKSAAPLTVASGETFNNDNLTLQTYGVGGVVISPANTTTTTSGTSTALSVVPNLTSATNSLAHTLYSINSTPTINESGTGVAVSNLYNLYSGLTKTAGTITNYYGNYIAAPTGAGTVTNTYALVTEATSGNVGIGTITPAGRLDITDTSNTAASLTLTNNTATTIGAGINTLGVIDLQSTSLTTGNLINVEANALTSGRIINISSTSTGLTSGSLVSVIASGDPGASWTGNLGLIEYTTSTDVDIDGSALKVGITGAGGGEGTVLNVTTAQTGTNALAMRVNDDGTYTDSTPFVIDETGNVGIGTISAGSALTVQRDANATTYQVELRNFDVTASALATAGIRLDLSTTTGGTTATAANIRAGKEATWTTTAATQDGFLAFDTILNGATAEKMRLTSAGNLIPGTTAAQDLGTSDAPITEWRNLNLNNAIQRGGTPVVNLATQTLGDQGGGFTGWVIEEQASISGTLGTTQLVVPGITFLGCTLATCNNGGSADVVVGNFGTGKIDVGTVDPPYTINGEKYATYVPGMIGQNEEVAGRLTTSDFVENLGYRYVIDFSDLPKASDLWLFSKVIDINKHISDITVMLTPESPAKTWYELDPAGLRLSIYSSKPTTISYRLTAPRFDSDKWTNVRTEGTRGFLIDSPDQPLNNLNGDTLIALDPVFTEQNINQYELKIGDNVITEIGSYAKLLVANLSAGFIRAEKLVSPIADIETLTVNTLTAQEASLSAIIVNEATVSGTLYANKIESPEISNIQSQLSNLSGDYASASAILASIRAKYSDYDSLSNPSGNNDPLTTDGLSDSNATISGELALYNQPVIITDTLLVNTTLVSNSLNSSEGALYLQPTASAPINLLAGLMTLTLDGKVNINGDLIVSGTLYAQNISANQSAISNLQSEIATISGSFTSNTASISGSLTSNEVITNGLLIASAASESATATSSAMLASNASIGTAIITADSTEISISNSAVRPGTYVYLTPISDTGNQVLYLKTKEEGVGFTVSINQPLTTDLKFNYWLIQTQP